MDVSIGADQSLLVETAARIAEDSATTETAGLPVGADAARLAADDAAWHALADMGFVGLRLDESVGGGGADSVDAALVAEQFGRRLSRLPFLGQSLIGPELLWRAGADSATLIAVTGGDRRLSVAIDASLRAITSRPGTALVAFDAHGAHAALAIDAGGQVREVALAATEEPGADLTRSFVATTGASVVVGRLTADDRTRIEAFALAMVSADLVGVMQGALDAAVAYVGARVQFGVPVGSFQAVQHLAAEAKVLLEASRSSMWHAAWAVDALAPHEALLAARQAKAYCSRAARRVGEVQTQLLGGIAITWEELAHVRVRRMLVDRSLLGDEHAQHDAIADSLLGGTA
jgi:alkylation response protein AidB-like acyl-CoA dehydrogenase